MMVFSDATLKAAGLDFAMARALLAPAEDEVVVHIHQCLDGPPVPQASHADLDYAHHRPGSPAIPSLVIASTPTDLMSDAQPQLPVYTPDRSSAPAATNCGYSAVAAPPLMRDLGKDTLGDIERDAQTLAATYGAELHPASHGEYTLVTRVGTTTHASLHAALKALKPPVEYLLDRIDAVTVKATPAAPTEPAIPLAGAFGTRLDVEIPVLVDGCSLNAIRYVAHLLGCEVQASKTGSVMLTGAFGSKVFGSFREARLALNKRAYVGMP